MGRGFFAGLGKVLDVGAAYLQHVQFVERASRAPQSELGELLVQYTQGLSEASFAGFKVTLAMLPNNQQDDQRKALIQSLLQGADAARSGNLAASLVEESTAIVPDQSGFDRDHNLISKWYEQLGNDQRINAMIEHVTGLTQPGYESFTANLSQMCENVLEHKRQHEENETNAWGGFAEDRMAYQMARLRTGQRDPAFMRRLGEIQDFLDFIRWLIKASDAVRKAHVEQEAAAAKPKPAAKPASPDAKAIREAVRTFTHTGQYPGGADQMQKDVMALCESSEGDEVMDMLKSMGATEGGDKILNMEDFYRPGNTLFELRWPLRVTLPMAFDELDHKTQYSVLFGEWTRRSMEGAYVLQQGDAAAAQAIFEECLVRAQQLEVAELIARSHEGLARVASRTNARAQERRSLKAAMAAREAG